MERWLESTWTAFADIYNCLDRKSYFFWDESALEEHLLKGRKLEDELTEMAWHARYSNPQKGAEMPDHGGRASIVIGNFMKSSYLPVVINQLSHQSLPPDRFEIILVDSADDPAFLSVARYCSQTWPELDIRAFETHEDRTKTVTTRRNVGAKQAKYDRIIMFDSDWLPVGENFLKSLLFRQTGWMVVRGTPFLAQTGGVDYGRWLRGPLAWKHKTQDWAINSPPEARVVKERNDHDFILSINREHYHNSRGFSEKCVGGSGIEDNFFNHALRRHLDRDASLEYGWAIDAIALNLNGLPTFEAVERCHPATLVPAGAQINNEDWGQPPTLEDLTPLLKC